MESETTSLIYEDMDLEKCIQITTFSLSKIVEKSNKLSKNVQNVLEREIENLQSALPFSIELKEKYEKVIKEIYNHFLTLEDVARIKEKIEHDAKLFKTICKNVRKN